jgi:anti-sigma factor RsiW
MTTEARHEHGACIEMFRKLSEYIDQELDEVTCRDIEAHARGCVACQSCLETLRRTVAICKQTREQPVPADFNARLQNVIAKLIAS